MGRGLAVSPSPPPPISLAVASVVVVVERLLPHIPPLLLPTVFLFSLPLEFYVPSHPPPCRFRFRLPFFVVFVVFIPRADRGVFYMRVLEKIGGFSGFVATGLGRSEHVQRR